MRTLYHFISFYFTKFYVFTYIFIKFLFGIKWEKVNEIYLPLEFSFGFNTLRWIVNHKYEINEISIIENTLQPEDIVIEIGTGLGFVSTFCSKKNGNNVFTYEANTNNYNICKKVFEKNNVSPQHENAILGEHDGFINFSINNKSILASSLINKCDTITKIKTKNLNDTISEIQPNYLIMDIEGGEYDIFKIINFQSIDKIQFELHPLLLREEKCNEIFQLLKTNHFTKNDFLSKNNNYYYTKNKLT
jgi:FkbM family methyltransferase